MKDSQLDIISRMYEKVTNIEEKQIPSLNKKIDDIKEENKYMKKEIIKNTDFRIQATTLHKIILTILAAIIFPLLVDFLK